MIIKYDYKIKKMKEIINIIQSKKYNFIKLHKVIYAIINDIIKDDYFEDNYKIFLNIFNSNNEVGEYLNTYIYYQFQLYINENIAFSQNDRIEIFKNISYVMIDLLGFINNDIKEHFFEKSIYYIKNNYKIIQNPYYNKKFIDYVNKKKRYINYIFKNKLYKSKLYENKKITYGGSKIHNLNDNEMELFNYFDNIHNFSIYSHINIDYKYYNLQQEDIKDIKKSKIEDYFVNRIDKKHFIKINPVNANDILNKIYNIIEKYKIVNDASGFINIFNKIPYISHIYLHHILNSIEERKYSVNTLANFLDSGNSLNSYINEKNNNHKNIKITNILNIINSYNNFLKEIFYNKNKYLFPQLESDTKKIILKLYINENNKINENKGYIKTLDLYKGFNSIQNMVGKLEVLEKFNKNKKYINEKYFFLRLKSMGDRIQAYEVYYTNKNLLTPIIVLKNKKTKIYESNKKLFLATNDKMLTYFSINGFEKMNILSVYKDNIILQNDLH